MMRQDDEILMQYADGELGDLAKARVERAAAQEPAVAARLERHRRLRAQVAEHYRPVADEHPPERLTSLLAGTVVDIATVRHPSRQARWVPAAIAASLAAGLVAGQLLPRGAGAPVAFKGGAMIAQGEVARALDTQLASTQPADAPVRIGVSFPGQDGRACRTFEATAIAGVACREGQRWQVLVTAPGGRASPERGYRQAGTDAVVMQAAQDMMSGAPLDAVAERRARDAGWTRGPDANVGRR